MPSSCSRHHTNCLDCSTQIRNTISYITTMATSASMSPGGSKLDFKLPMPPPLLHTRSGNALYDGPSTPTSTGFTTPYATPQGSPSKSKLPPGAKDLPSVFENALKLAPTSPSKAGRQQLSPHSPNKAGKQMIEDGLSESVIYQEQTPTPGSPSRKSNKENTPPGGRTGKEPNQAAISRQEQYQGREISNASSKSLQSPTRGLTPAELEKLQLPKVKRLANVTQICMFPLDITTAK